MLVCSKCLCEMTCVKTGCVCLFCETKAHRGDEYKCMDCGAVVRQLNNNGFYCPDPDLSDNPLYCGPSKEAVK